MENHSKPLPCDGCGFPASSEHIAERVGRLELATRFRPVHMHVLFVALAPIAGPENDFYGPPQSKVFFDPFMDALGITAPSEKLTPGTDDAGKDAARLAEFQRRGFYLSYLSECPVPEHRADGHEFVSALGPTLIRRIRLNYKPQKIALLGEEMAPMIEFLENAGLGPQLLLNQGRLLTVPEQGNLAARTGFLEVLSRATTSENLISEYDSIQFKQT